MPVLLGAGYSERNAGQRTVLFSVSPDATKPGSCACRVGGASAGGTGPAAALLGLVGLGLVLVRRRGCK